MAINAAHCLLRNKPTSVRLSLELHPKSVLHQQALVTMIAMSHLRPFHWTRLSRSLNHLRHPHRPRRLVYGPHRQSQMHPKQTRSYSVLLNHSFPPLVSRMQLQLITAKAQGPISVRVKTNHNHKLLKTTPVNHTTLPKQLIIGLKLKARNASARRLSSNQLLECITRTWGGSILQCLSAKCFSIPRLIYPGWISLHSPQPLAES